MIETKLEGPYGMLDLMILKTPAGMCPLALNQGTLYPALLRSDRNRRARYYSITWHRTVATVTRMLESAE